MNPTGGSTGRSNGASTSALNLSSCSWHLSTSWAQRCAIRSAGCRSKCEGSRAGIEIGTVRGRRFWMDPAGIRSASLFLGNDEKGSEAVFRRAGGHVRPRSTSPRCLTHTSSYVRQPPVAHPSTVSPGVTNAGSGARGEHRLRGVPRPRRTDARSADHEEPSWSSRHRRG